jgi:hypothetical protein
MNQERLKISIIPFLLAGMVFVIFTGMFVYFLVTGIKDMTESLQRFTVPGTAVLELTEPGKYTLYHEFSGTIEGERYFTTHFPSYELTIRSIDTDREIFTSPASVSEKYNFKDQQGTSLLNFEIKEPGKYEFTFIYRNGDINPLTVLAVGKEMIPRIFKTIFLCFIILFTGIVSPFIIVVIYLIKSGIFKTLKKSQPECDNRPVSDITEPENKDVNDNSDDEEFTLPVDLD